MRTWLVTVSVVVFGLLQLLDSSTGESTETPPILLGDYDTQCSQGAIAKVCVEQFIKPTKYPNRCDAWNEISVRCFVDSNCSDSFIKLKKSDFEKQHGVVCSVDFYGNCKKPKDVWKCENENEYQDYLDKCDAWDKLLVCYTEAKCLDAFIKDKKQAFRSKFSVECADDFYEWNANCPITLKSRQCEKDVNPDSYNDKCVAWDKFDDCYTKWECSESFITDKKNAFKDKYSTVCTDVKIDAGNYGTKGLRISTVCGTSNVSCESSKDMTSISCQLWRTLRSCFDKSSCLSNEVESIENRFLSRKGLTCGSSSLGTSLGFIIPAAVLFMVGLN